MFGFPEWAVRHFGPITTRKFYFLSHVPMFVAVPIVSLGAALFPGVDAFLFLWVVALIVVFTNGIFHLGTTFLFKEYSPGVVTSLIFTFPFGWLCYANVVSDLRFGRTELLLAAIVGCAISGLVVYSLTWKKII